jgi:hypothetical protein
MSDAVSFLAASTVHMFPLHAMDSPEDCSTAATDGEMCIAPVWIGADMLAGRRILLDTPEVGR